MSCPSAPGFHLEDQSGSWHFAADGHGQSEVVGNARHLSPASVAEYQSGVGFNFYSAEGADDLGLVRSARGALFQYLVDEEDVSQCSHPDFPTKRDFVVDDLLPHGQLRWLDCLSVMAPMPDQDCPLEGTHASNETERFNEMDGRPPMPSHALFGLEVTTFYVPHAAPWEIGNHVLDLLSSRPSSVRQVCRKRHTIKAVSFLDRAMCTLQVRLYSDPQPGKYAVEFQRLNGDCLAFNHSYQQAAKYMMLHYEALEGGPEVFIDFSPPALHMAVGDLTEEDLYPLLDMAGSTEHPSVQAECASSLANIAEQDAHAREYLCNSSSFDEIGKLLDSDDTAVGYPTARLLASLAKCPRATERFASTGLLPKIVDKLRSERICSLVKEELAEVLRLAAELSASALEPGVSQEMLGSIAAVLQDMGTGCAPLYSNLQEAQRALTGHLAAGSHASAALSP